MADQSLADKVIIITGAGGGIGREMCREFAQEGAITVLVGRTRETLETVAKDLRGNLSIVIPTDITKPAQVERLVTEVVESCGRIDALINNAGGGVAPCAAEDTLYDDWIRMIDINLTATFNCCMAIGKQMIEQRSGKIVNISSTAGTKGHPGMLHYSAAKAGVLSLTNNLAYSWADHNICVNAVVPGLIATPAMIKYGVTPASVREDGTEMPPLKLAPGPRDVSKLCSFLISDAANMITGESIPIRAWNPTDRFWS